MRLKTKYITADGEEFDTPEAALEHEDSLLWHGTLQYEHFADIIEYRYLQLLYSKSRDICTKQEEERLKLLINTYLGSFIHKSKAGLI